MSLNMALVRQGLTAKLGLSNFAALMAIIANADKEGVCKVRYPELAEQLGITPRSVGRKIQELFQFELEGKPILQRVPGGGIKVVPEILVGGQNCPVYNSNIDIKHINNVKSINASTVLSYFGIKYKEAYGCDYSFMFQRDLSLVKSKLLQVYGAENTLKIIDEAFRQRSLFENPPKYPYIAIGGLVTFIANKVMTDIQQAKKQDSFDIVAHNQQMKEKYWDEYFGD